MKKIIFSLFLIFNIISYSGYYSVTVTATEAGKQLVRLLEYKYIITSARWMWLPEEWTSYVTTKVQLKKQLRKVKVSMEYNDSISD